MFLLKHNSYNEGNGFGNGFGDDFGGGFGDGFGGWLSFGNSYGDGYSGSGDGNGCSDTYDYYHHLNPLSTYHSMLLVVTQSMGSTKCIY